jgi:leucyl aminopeptidase (aminopeptidase T)
MPRFLPEMLYPGGPMAADYGAIASETEAMAGRITRAREVRITNPAGTEIEFSVEGRDGRADSGLYAAPGGWGNLPAGEAYCAPVEGTARGRLVVEPGWHGGLAEPMTIRLEAGEVVAIERGGAVGREIAGILDLPGRGEAFRPRRMLAELGIGTNPNARRTDITVEAEKIKGTVHLAVGDNAHIGGTVVADYHQDFVLPKPSVLFDGQLVIAEGRWVGLAPAGQ